MIPFKNRVLDKNIEVEVYRCLNRKGKFYSIRQKGKVVAHTESFIIKDCKFIVNSSGKKLCLKTKERNVHAFIKGLLGTAEDIDFNFSPQLKYNPFSDRGFYTNYTSDLEKAKVVYTQFNNILVQI